jgi:hypothetical protein
VTGTEPAAPRRRLHLAQGGVLPFLLRRGAQAVFVIFGVACVTFFVLRLVPGDPARLMVRRARGGRTDDPEQLGTIVRSSFSSELRRVSVAISAVPPL